jgi:hypothetical protein
MPAEAGIQAVGDSNKFKDLDSRLLLKTCRDRFREHDATFPFCDKVSKGGGNFRDQYQDPFQW